MIDEKEKKQEKEVSKIPSDDEQVEVPKVEVVVATPMVDKAMEHASAPRMLVKPKPTAALDIFTEQHIEKAKYLVDSGLLPDGVDTPQKALVIMQKGHELGFTAMASFEHIVVINGKPSLDGAALGNLLARGGVEWKVLRNAEPVWEKDYKGDEKIYVITKQGTTPIYTIATKEQIDTNIPTLGKKRVDVVTEIEFKRKSKLTDEILTHISKFSYTKAVTAGLAGKDVWKKYLEVMLYWRALSLGARQFAPDLTLGMLSAEEAGNGDVWIDADGKVVDVNN